MPIDFFDLKCKTEAEQTNVVFGLCGHGRLAYSTLGAGIITEKQAPLIIFVELKDEHYEWIHTAIRQLESTIVLFCRSYNPKLFSKRMAYAVNSNRPYFRYNKK